MKVSGDVRFCYLLRSSRAMLLQIGDCVGVYWRPNFENNILYPYLPPHITKPKVLVPIPVLAV